MERTEVSNGNYVVAATVGAICGGLAAVLAMRGLPKMLSEMKEHLHEICERECACAKPDTEAKAAGESVEAGCN